LTPTLYTLNFALPFENSINYLKSNEIPMKKLLIFTILSFITLSTAFSQTTFKTGDVEFATGIGIFNTFAKDDATTVVPPISARIGVRLNPKFSMAAYAAYSVSEINNQVLADGSIRDLENEFLMLGLRAAAHANPRPNLDIYGGAVIGYNIPTVTENINGAPKSAGDDAPSFSRPAENEFTYSAFVGAAYYPKERIGVFAEVGYGISILSTGITLKI
jgi:hypothetical protein